MNLLTRQGTAITFDDLPSRSRVLSDQELEEIMGRGCDNEGKECNYICDSCCASKGIGCHKDHDGKTRCR